MKKKDLKIIQGIQAQAWAKFGDKLFVEKEKAGKMKEVIDKALNNQEEHGIEIDDDMRDKLQNIKDSGMLDGSHKEEDPKVAKEFEKYVAKRIEEEIEAGNLSKPKRSKKKARQYSRRKRREELDKANK